MANDQGRDAPPAQPPAALGGVFSDFRIVGATALGIIAGSLALSSLYAFPVAGARTAGPLLWELALLAGGAAIGFLFGIPKVLQSARERDAAPPGPPGSRASGYQLRVNTNLEEISDWLTKIIVGLGLIQLKEMPHFARVLSAQIAASFGPGAADEQRSVALAIVVLFPAMGFIFGFLATRLYIQGALARADLRAGAEAVGFDAVDLKLQNLEVRMDTLTRTRVADLGEPEEAEADGPEAHKVDARLEELAREYLKVKDPDWTIRVAKKNNLAAQMHKHVLEHRISRDALLEAARAAYGAEQGQGGTTREPSADGLVMALATCAQAVPQPEDTERLLTVASQVARKHVQYRIVLAFTNLFEQGLVSPRQRSRIIAVLDSYVPRADASLRALIDRALRVFRGDVGGTFAPELR